MDLGTVLKRLIWASSFNDKAERIHFIEKIDVWEFLGGLVVKTPRFHCRGLRVPSLMGNRDAA